TEWREQQSRQLQQSIAELPHIPEWKELTQEERNNAAQRLEGIAEPVTRNLDGLSKLLSRGHDINLTLDEVKNEIRRLGRERIRQRQEAEGGANGGETCLSRTVAVPAKITGADDIDTLIR